MRAHLLLPFFLLGCEGALEGPRPVRVPTPVTAGVDAGPEKCEPGVHEVPKLLRVSNHEYRTMVSDVLGTAVSADIFTRWTPIAQVYGFDTMSESRIDAQALEVQLASAERLAALVLATPALTAHCPAAAQPQAPLCSVKGAYPSATDFSDTQGRDCWSYLDSSGTPMGFENARVLWKKNPDEGVLIWAAGMHPGPTVDAVRRWMAPLTGTVALTGHFADGDSGGGDGVVVSIRKNGQPLWTRTITNGGVEAAFTLDVSMIRGENLDFVVNRNGNTSYDSTALAANIGFTVTPLKASWSWGNCVGPLVDKLASRGFRRPVRVDERADYQQLFESSRQGASAAGFTEPADEAISAVVQAVLLSPNLVFKPELVPGGLDPQERAFGIASRLSLFVRSSVADEELWNLAGTGALNDKHVIELQARRLLEADLPRFTRNFGGQWLDFRDSEDLGPLTASMQAESAGVFSEVLAGDLPAERLLSPGFTFADAPLAYHYGLPSGSGDKVSTPLRGGLLSQGLFLTRTATGSEFRRPIHRGLWTLTRLLCRSLPRLDAATLEEISNSVSAIDRTLPLREQMAIHRQNAARCAGCHGMMDPIGLALEKYDRTGLWRDAYPNGSPITNDLELDGVVVGDPMQLAVAIQNSPDYRACVATKLLTFGLNRGPLDSERCVANAIATPADGSKPTLKQMTLNALIQSLQLTEVP